MTEIRTQIRGGSGFTFDPDAFSHCIGREVTLKVKGKIYGTAVVRYSTVSDDRKLVELVLDIPDELTPPDDPVVHFGFNPANPGRIYLVSST